MPNVELTPTQVAFLETWLDADIPEGEAIDVSALLTDLDEDSADIADLWVMARSSAEASLAALKAELGKSDDPNLQRIAEYGIMDILGGNLTAIGGHILALRMAAPDDRTAKAAAVSTALADLENHLATSALVALVEDNVFGIPVDVRTPINRAVKAIRRNIAA